MLDQRRIRWANISPALGQRLLFDCLHDRMGHTDGENAQTQTERTKVNQHVPTSSEGRLHKLLMLSRKAVFIITRQYIIILVSMSGG